MKASAPDTSPIRRPGLGRGGLIAFLAFGFLALAFLIAPPILHAVTPPPIYYKNQPFPVVGPVHAGQAIPMRVERCNRTDQTVSYTVDRGLTPEANQPDLSPVVLANGQTTIDPGCQKVFSKLNTVPLGTVPGWYHLTGVVHGQGQWGAYEIAWRSQPFQVIP